ncbi:hypothetical protein KUH03_18325 [Sphingobacterium sp. E70]|uniref:hypothetical protein n=1 Tax=Sphingobacterium sp. E70 TaxID=2853439 RepID=UPI00211D043F|nr:hypothetical protein [Sphingobacterium sp. E70]ULT28358.1 hypothetical protein KUH03_18325 [Sphingobacterium sp. E70]
MLETLPIVVSAYDSERQILKVVMEIYAHETGKRLANVQLSPSGDWLWQAKVPLGKQKDNTMPLLPSSMKMVNKH